MEVFQEFDPKGLVFWGSALLLEFPGLGSVQLSEFVGEEPFVDITLLERLEWKGL